MTMRRFVTCFLICLLIFSPARAKDDDGMMTVRDAEIENTLETWSAPVWKAAGLNPSSMRVVLVPDGDLNAFTAGGLVIFMTTGLIMQATSPEEIIGVIGHETGHVVGGHVLSSIGRARTASYESVIGMVLGMGAGLLSGNGQVANAITTFSQAGAMHGYLAHSRLEESSADQAAISFLNEAKIPTWGLGSFMEKLEDQELLPASQQRAFARTHPVTRDRIQALEYRIKGSTGKMPDADYAQLARIQAKLLAFTSPARALDKYNGKTDTIALMARAIATYQQNRIIEALKLADQWLAKEPDNPYAYELKAQILKDGSRPADAVPVYEEALKRAPREGLIRIDAAHAMLESGNDGLINKSIAYLNTGIETEPRSTLAFRLLSTAYARKGMEPEAQIYLAEMSTLQRDYKRARQLLGIARPKLAANSPAARRASDLKLMLDTLDKDEEDH